MRLGDGRPRAVACDAQKIRALRGQRTQAEIAKRALVSPGVVRIAELPGAHISNRVLERLAAALGVSAEEIRIHTPIINNTPPARRRERGLALEEFTSLGLGSSLAAAVVNDSAGFDDL